MVASNYQLQFQEELKRSAQFNLTIYLVFAQNMDFSARYYVEVELLSLFNTRALLICYKGGFFFFDVSATTALQQASLTPTLTSLEPTKIRGIHSVQYVTYLFWKLACD